MLAEFFAWWTEQMRELVAPLTRIGSGGPKDALVLARDSGDRGSWRVGRRRDGTVTPLASLAADATDAEWRQAFASRRRGEPVVVTLGQPFLVRRTTFPLAAAANLDRVLSYEMDRLTPFAARDVVFSHQIVSRHAASGTLLVDVAVVPAAWLRDPLERLAALSIRPEALEEAADPSGPQPAAALEFPAPAGQSRSDPPPRRIPLDHADPAHRARARLFWRAAAGSCAALAAAVILVPFVRQSLALAAVEERIALLRPGMARVEALRHQIAAGTAGSARIATARRRQGTALRVLGELTDLLPDDTFLTSVSLRQAHLTIEGQSAAATRLIAAMAADPRLSDPAFGAPVVRAPNGTDVFTIQAGFGS